MPNTPTTSAENLLASLLSSFGTKPKAEKRKPGAKKLPANATPLPQHIAFNFAKTGYREWRALGKVVELQEQHCSCCGEVTLAVKGEYFELENGHAHSIWLRPEGYGISAQEDLPIRYTSADPVSVIACGQCKLPETDEAFLAIIRNSQQLSFPF